MLLRAFILFTFSFIPFTYSTINQLSFSGGGAYGALQLGILKNLTENGHHTNYDLYTGISVGAINAGILSYFKNIKEGINIGEIMWINATNDDVYKLYPPTGVSLLNTDPLFNWLNKTINSMPNEPQIHTLIGATNLQTGNLDIFSFKENENLEKVNLLMASSALPILFPPVKYKGNLYTDGGLLSNALLTITQDSEYKNITFIASDNFDITETKTEISSFISLLQRTASVYRRHFKEPLYTLHQNCTNPVGEINKYFIDSNFFSNYNKFNFNNGKELFELGYRNVQHKKYILC